MGRVLGVFVPGLFLRAAGFAVAGGTGGPSASRGENRRGGKLYGAQEIRQRGGDSDLPEALVLTRLKDKDRGLAVGEVESAAFFVRYIGAELLAHDHVPGGVVLLVKLRLQFLGNAGVWLFAFNEWCCPLHSVHLQVLRHVAVVNSQLLIGHRDYVTAW